MCEILFYLLYKSVNLLFSKHAEFPVWSGSCKLKSKENTAFWRCVYDWNETHPDKGEVTQKQWLHMYLHYLAISTSLDSFLLTSTFVAFSFSSMTCLSIVNADLHASLNVIDYKSVTKDINNIRKPFLVFLTL